MYGMNPYPYGYPSPSPMPNYTQQMSQQAQYGMPASQQNGMEVATVQTLQQVEQVQMQPGQRKLIMVQNEPVIAARSADNMGLVTTEYYKLEKFDPSAVPTSPSAKYITEEQLEARLSAFAETLKPATSRSKKEAASE